MQDNINTLNKELVDAKISLDEIYLDPNNPRFTSLKWDDIPDHLFVYGWKHDNIQVFHWHPNFVMSGQIRLQFLKIHV